LIEDAATRLQARAVWDLLIFVLNGLLFILVGVQLRSIWDALPAADASRAIGEAVMIGLTVILVRFVWVGAAAAAQIWMKDRKVASSPVIDWRDVVVIAWAGLRGGDTLAAALSVPLVTDAGAPFPVRHVIIFLAFSVIVVTLVGPGLSLSWLIRKLVVVGDDVEAREETLARKAVTEAAVTRLDELAGEEWAPTDLVTSLRQRHAHQLDLLKAGSDDSTAFEHVERHQRLRREVLDAERAALLRLRDEGEIGDDVLRRVEQDLDLEEARFQR
jgi:CPA1 family monovalent cation:H+ antiporter